MAQAQIMTKPKQHSATEREVCTEHQRVYFGMYAKMIFIKAVLVVVVAVVVLVGISLWWWWWWWWWCWW